MPRYRLKPTYNKINLFEQRGRVDDSMFEYVFGGEK